jgi:hypothetical protein
MTDNELLMDTWRNHPDPQQREAAWREILINRNFTAGNLGDGSVYGLVPYDLAGQRKPAAEDDEDENAPDKPQRT